MLITTIVPTEITVDVKTLHVEAVVRYWEDAYVNSQKDTEHGDNIPCKEGNLWKPVIDIESGCITNWRKGTTASLYYKVCDECKCTLKNAKGEAILEKVGYVPNILSPKEQGFGDYIIMDINTDGYIKDWRFEIEGFSLVS